MDIKQDFIPINPFSRPGLMMREVKGIVFHWMAFPGATVKQLSNYFGGLKNQDSRDDAADRYASTQFGIDCDGRVIQLMPENEIAYHVGAKRYTAFAEKVLGAQYTSNSSNHNTPNGCLIGCELSHLDYEGNFTWRMIRSAISLAVYLCKRYLLKPETQIFRHYDITGKLCPKYWVDNPEDWEYFKKIVAMEVRNGQKKVA